MNERPSAPLLFVPLVAVVLLVLTGSGGEAAMWLRMTIDPAEPVVGSSAHVTVLTLANFNSSCINDPAADARPWWDWNGNGGRDLRFDLKAFQADRAIDIPLTRRDSDPAYWDGSITFPAPGEWTVRMVYPLWSGGVAAGEECAGARINVVARSSPSLPATSTDVRSGPVAALAIVPVAVSAIAMFGLRRPRRARSL